MEEHSQWSGQKPVVPSLVAEDGCQTVYEAVVLASEASRDTPTAGSSLSIRFEWRVVSDG